MQGFGVGWGAAWAGGFGAPAVPAFIPPPIWVVGTPFASAAAAGSSASDAAVTSSPETSVTDDG